MRYYQSAAFSLNLIRILVSISILLFFSEQLRAETEREVFVQLAHSRPPRSFDVSPDGRYLVTGADFTVRLWSTSNGRQIRILRGHSDAVTSVLYHPDGRHVLSCSLDNTIRMWNAASGKEVAVLKSDRSLHTMAVSPDGKTILTPGGIGERNIDVWDLETKKRRASFPGHKESTTCLAFSHDGKLFASGGRDRAVNIWNAREFIPVRTLVGHGESIVSIEFSPDDRQLISASYDRSARIWEMKSGTLERSFPLDFPYIANACFSPDGKLISASGGETSSSGDKKVFIWDSSSGRLLRTISQRDLDHFTKIGFSRDGRYIISSNANNSLYLWDIERGISTRSLGGFAPQVYCVAFSPDGKLCALGHSDGSVSIWDINAMSRLWRMKKHGMSVLGIAFTRDGKKLISASGHELRTDISGTLILWDAKSGEALRENTDSNGSYESIDISSDGKTLLSANKHNWEKSIMLWDIDGIVMRRKYEFKNFPDRAKFASGSLALVSVRSEGVVLFDLSAWRVIKTYPESTLLSISRDKRFFSSMHGGVLSLRNTTSGDIYKNHKFDGSCYIDIRDTAFSPDGRYVAFGGTKNAFGCSSAYNFEIFVWDLRSDKIIRNLTGHREGTVASAFSPDGRYLLTGSMDATARLWDFTNGNSISLVSGDRDWVIFNDQGYFDASREGGELVNVSSVMDVFAIDQFALKSNRPDMLMRSMGIGSLSAINHYSNEFRKRLRKFGIGESTLGHELQVPEVMIVSVEQKGHEAVITSKFTDSRHLLKSYSIYVNDVPIFGSRGKPLGGNAARKTDSLELSDGLNKIELSCFNDRGAESYRALAYINCAKKTRGDLYYVGFGVSSYKDASLNLKYADKDARDLADMCSGMKGKYSNVFTKTYLNEEVTVENIKKAKDFLKNAKVDDTFVLFIAGHGVHDTDRDETYYFLTHNADRYNFSGSCANFELVEDLLQGIAPRNKLFLMDTCESGEIEDAVQDRYYAAAGSRGLKARAARALKIAPKAGKGRQARTYLYQKDRYVYNDLMRRSGAIVFSSSRGGEFSYESDAIQNGYFTKEIISAIQDRAADKNRDGLVSTNELREHVSRSVAKRTGDLQHPTVDRDNLYQKFAFPVK